MTDVLDHPSPVFDPAPLPPKGASGGGFDARRAGIGVAMAGAVGMVVGMAVDGIEHSLDPTLVQREGLFTLTNVGHALLLLGAGAVVAGLLLALLGPFLYRTGARGETAPARRIAQLTAPLVLLAVFAGVAVWGSNSSLAAGPQPRRECGDRRWPYPRRRYGRDARPSDRRVPTARRGHAEHPDRSDESRARDHDALSDCRGRDRGRATTGRAVLGRFGCALLDAAQHRDLRAQRVRSRPSDHLPVLGQRPHLHRGRRHVLRHERCGCAGRICGSERRLARAPRPVPAVHADRYRPAATHRR